MCLPFQAPALLPIRMLLAQASHSTFSLTAAVLFSSANMHGSMACSNPQMMANAMADGLPDIAAGSAGKTIRR